MLTDTAVILAGGKALEWALITAAKNRQQNYCRIYCRQVEQ